LTYFRLYDLITPTPIFQFCPWLKRSKYVFRTFFPWIRTSKRVFQKNFQMYTRKCLEIAFRTFGSRTKLENRGDKGEKIPYFGSYLPIINKRHFRQFRRPVSNSKGLIFKLKKPWKKEVFWLHRYIWSNLLEDKQKWRSISWIAINTSLKNQNSYIDNRPFWKNISNNISN
jgi:hypothetical protein